NVLNTTHIVGYRNTASTLNNIIGSYLPSVDEHTEPYESVAIDYMNNIQISPTDANKLFHHYINFTTKLILKEGMRVMFLNNSLFKKGLFNDFIGVVLKIIYDDIVQVAFPLKTGISNVIVVKETSYFR
ncbi:4900_t:CDS:1, partial [Diversispora eburnea]